eukprot:755875-Hanusia_phi.AAC.7
MDRQLELPSFDAIRKASINAFRLKAPERFMLSNPCNVLQDVELHRDLDAVGRTKRLQASAAGEATEACELAEVLQMFSTFYPQFLQQSRLNLDQPVSMQRLVYLNNALLEMAMLHAQFATATQVFKAMEEDGIAPDADTLASMALVMVAIRFPVARLMPVPAR